MDTISNWIVITGPTASGKTSLAVAVAERTGGEIVSADSRQVYRGLTIGSGKDLGEYRSGNKAIPYHMIDIVNPDSEYHIAEFLNDANSAIADIESRQKIPVICGGSGLYLQSLLEQPAYVHVPIDSSLRALLATDTKQALQKQYKEGVSLPFEVDYQSKKRLIRAIEIQQYLTRHEAPEHPDAHGKSTPIFLLAHDREIRRDRISQRLVARVNEGLIEEVVELRKCYSDDILIRFGLEYKFITQYLQGKYDKKIMLQKLESGIHQFAKRQMTWFRRMERQGYRVLQLPVQDGQEAMVDFILTHTR